MLPKFAILHFLLLLPALLLSQRPPTPGKLSVTSDPTGAAIKIDGKSMGRSTPFTFIVSPGGHTLVLEGESVPQPCATPTTVTVRSGSTASIRCSSAGWGQTSYQ